MKKINVDKYLRKKEGVYSSKYSAYTVMREAAKSVILIDMLENMGYRCNLFIVKYNVYDFNKSIMERK